MVVDEEEQATSEAVGAAVIFEAVVEDLAISGVVEAVRISTVADVAAISAKDVVEVVRTDRNCLMFATKI